MALLVDMPARADGTYGRHGYGSARPRREVPDGYREAMAKWKAAGDVVESIQRQHPEHAALRASIDEILSQFEGATEAQRGVLSRKAAAIHQELADFVTRTQPQAMQELRAARRDVEQRFPREG